MPSFYHDQAAGLRRIMQGPKPRVVSVLSASTAEHQTRLMTNLAASIQRNGSDVLIVHATEDSRETINRYGLGGLPSLLDVIQGKASIDDATRQSQQGFAVSKLLPRGLAGHVIHTAYQPELDVLLAAIATERSLVLVDAMLNSDNLLPLQLLNQSEIMVQLSRDADSIKQAYGLIKQLSGQVGRRSFGILVNNANDDEAQVVFRNIAQVARRYLHIELVYIGAIPADEHLKCATKLGRAVVDAFPMAAASNAFKMLANRLGYNQSLATAASPFI